MIGLKGSKRSSARAGKRDGSLEQLLEGLPTQAPRFVEPMKCRLAGNLPQSEDWVYEIKFDGFRALALKSGSEVRLLSRNKRDFGSRFPGVVEAVRALPFEQLMLDGEIVALDENGRSSFQLLQGAEKAAVKNAGLFFYAFDVLNVNGHDTTGLPLLKRKEMLQKMIQGKSGCIRLSDVLDGSIEELTALMQQLGLEGLIAKKRHSTYEIGARSGSWVKFKWGREQEFVIGGYTNPEGSRPYFGAVLVGYYDGSNLIFAGKAGAGFNAKLLKSMFDRFQGLRLDKTPFANLPERGGVIGPSQMRFCKWVEPVLVCQVRFSEWTRDGHLREPVFLGLREDKEAREVIQEKPVKV